MDCCFCNKSKKSTILITQEWFSSVHQNFWDIFFIYFFSFISKTLLMHCILWFLGQIFQWNEIEGRGDRTRYYHHRKGRPRLDGREDRSKTIVDQISGKSGKFGTTVGSISRLKLFRQQARGLCYKTHYAVIYKKIRKYVSML